VDSVARERLATSLATRLAARLGQPAPMGPRQAELFLETVAAALGASHREDPSSPAGHAR